MTPAIARLAFLDALAAGEDYDPADYNELYGGGHFEGYEHFPQWSGKEGPAGISHAAGRYQYEPRSWAEDAGRLGLTDFSPASQDAAAWYRANVYYKRNTGGRSLEADLVAGDASRVAGALKSQWTSLNPTTFPRRFAAAVAQRSVGGADGAASVPSPIPASPARPAGASIGTPVNTLAATGLGGWLAYYAMAYLQTRGWNIADLGLQASTYGLCTVAAAIVLHCFPWLSSAAGTDPPLSSLGVSKMLKVTGTAALLLLVTGCAAIGPVAAGLAGAGGAAATMPMWAPAVEAVVQGAVEGYVEGKAEAADKAHATP